MSRPERDISKAEVKRIEDLALKGCQTKTIESITGIPETTLRRRFGELLHKKRAERKEILLDRINADESTTMLIFRAKNDLGWTDKTEQTVKADIKMYDKDAPVEDV